ncbi:MAG: TIGR03936 family radical SAM-associated protein [Firmicutes bacterium]|nr:TIGR03936 family radical SAM-associated protein [Bacillota bacterium]
MKYRFKLYKGDEIKFIGHLDLLVAFQRVLKRAGMPIAYSQGFNPHQLVAFASPLSLGLTSTAEYGDFTLKEDLDAEFVMEKMNEHMPDGLKITSLVKLADGVKNTMSSLERAEYELYFDNTVTPEDIKANLENFMERKEILTMKKTKKGINETDIRPDIFWAKDISTEDAAAVEIQVSSGSIRNLKGETFAEAFCNHMGKEYNKYAIKCVRTEMLMKKGEDEFVPLNYGVER